MDAGEVQLRWGLGLAEFSFSEFALRSAPTSERGCDVRQ